jgi:hypothetical protein
MRTATGLALVAIGAILAFAVTSHPSFLNLQVAGWVIMLTGIAGMIVPRRGYGWLRRRVVVRRGHRGVIDLGERPVLSTGGTVIRPPGGRRPGDAVLPRSRAAGDPTIPGAGPAEETIEEFVEE